MVKKKSCSKAQLAALAKGRAKLARMRSQRGGAGYDIDALVGSFDDLSIREPVTRQPGAVTGRGPRRGRAPAAPPPLPPQEHRRHNCCPNLCIPAAALAAFVAAHRGRQGAPVTDPHSECIMGDHRGHGGFVPDKFLPGDLTLEARDACGPKFSQNSAQCVLNRGRKRLAWQNIKADNYCAMASWDDKKNRWVFIKPKQD
tara:strand:+ start:4134 stop:4733 length:600 start_codon:yes stop_codon:yes gene_type:complete